MLYRNWFTKESLSNPFQEIIVLLDYQIWLCLGRKITLMCYTRVKLTRIGDKAIFQDNIFPAESFLRYPTK